MEHVKKIFVCSCDDVTRMVNKRVYKFNLDDLNRNLPTADCQPSAA